MRRYLPVLSFGISLLLAATVFAQVPPRTNFYARLNALCDARGRLPPGRSLHQGLRPPELDHARQVESYCAAGTELRLARDQRAGQAVLDRLAEHLDELIDLSRGGLPKVRSESTPVVGSRNLYSLIAADVTSRLSSQRLPLGSIRERVRLLCGQVHHRRWLKDACISLEKGAAAEQPAGLAGALVKDVLLLPQRVAQPRVPEAPLERLPTHLMMFWLDALLQAGSPDEFLYKMASLKTARDPACNLLASHARGQTEAVTCAMRTAIRQSADIFAAEWSNPIDLQLNTPPSRYYPILAIALGKLRSAAMDDVPLLIRQQQIFERSLDKALAGQHDEYTASELGKSSQGFWSAVLVLSGTQRGSSVPPHTLGGLSDLVSALIERDLAEFAHRCARLGQGLASPPGSGLPDPAVFEIMEAALKP